MTTAGSPAEMCRACAAPLPPESRFCIECGQPVVPAAVARCPVCGAAGPSGARFCVACGAALGGGRPAHIWRARRASPAPVVGVFLIGLGLLMLTHWWWPGLLVLAGAVSVAAAMVRGRARDARQLALWLFGLAALDQFGWWWPGLLLLAGLSALLAGSRLGMGRPARRGYHPS